MVNDGVIAEAPNPRASEISIPGDPYHLWGQTLIARYQTPVGASANAPVPACIILHGSGGLFREGEPGESCDEDMDSRYQDLAQLLDTMGIASLAPSSFYSRDRRFCEDNSDEFLNFAPPPFFPPQLPASHRSRDDAYKMRRIVIRTLDALASLEFLQDQPEVNVSSLCAIATSNGSTVAMTYAANDLERHLVEYLTNAARTYENDANNDYAERWPAVMSLPALSSNADHQLADRPTLRFVHAIAPGCGLREVIPDIEPDEAQIVDDLYYPDGATKLIIEGGTNDDVVSACAEAFGDGVRERQARHVEQQLGVDPSRYVIHVHPGSGHDLLNEVGAGDVIRTRLEGLVDTDLIP